MFIKQLIFEQMSYVSQTAIDVYYSIKLEIWANFKSKKKIHEVKGALDISTQNITVCLVLIKA